MLNSLMKHIADSAPSDVFDRIKSNYSDFDCL